MPGHEPVLNKEKKEKKNYLEKEVDYLTEDDPLSNQKYVCISIITSASVENWDGDKHINGVKIRGVYSDWNEAVKRCEYLREVDPKHNVYIGEVGKWLPFLDDPEKAKDEEYAEKELNKIMKAYNENQLKAKILHEQRKNDMMEQAMMEQTKLKKKNRKKKKKKKKLLKKKAAKKGIKLDDEDVETGCIPEEIKEEVDQQLSDSDDPMKNDPTNVDKEEEFKKREEIVESQGKELDAEKEQLMSDKKMLADGESRVGELDKELAKARELYKKLTQSGNVI